MAYKRDDQTITVLVPNNPKGEGTAAHHMFEQYKKVATVGEYDSAIRASAEERRQMGLPPRADRGRAALRWDLERGFIRLD
jgi:hypothetical protein